jgi:hypothetical protein
MATLTNLLVAGGAQWDGDGPVANSLVASGAVWTGPDGGADPLPDGGSARRRALPGESRNGGRVLRGPSS